MLSILYFMIVLVLLCLIMPIVCFYVNVRSAKLEKICRPHNRRCRRRRRPAFYTQSHQSWLNSWQIQTTSTTNNNCSQNDRQGNVFTIHDENNQVNRYNDIFYIETNNADAARARAQLEKDDKDLPTYEEVMRITSAANSASTSIMAATSTSNVNTTNTIDSTLALPPYSAIFCNDRTGAVNSCERSAALSSPNVASTSTEHTTIALSSSLGFSNTISTQTQTAAPPSSSSNV
ncbi:uncharacterized protein LOC119636885 isoform X1 [Glossina fuscipes]|uniref:Uncharacterized protein LOC119636885 isoform X1 n=1 Tax=Glossina fuscipes TaxID=7396 RepID=A0A9C6DR64_9MUSC|nr:uncharacterized protein LOC119636885 isoform X1 [Glossina fuscipes]